MKCRCGNFTFEKSDRVCPKCGGELPVVKEEKSGYREQDGCWNCDRGESHAHYYWCEHTAAVRPGYGICGDWARG